MKTQQNLQKSTRFIMNQQRRKLKVIIKEGGPTTSFHSGNIDK